MLLNNLIKGLDVVSVINNNNPEICGIKFDSRKVESGDIFICLKGNDDCNKYVCEAIKNGAVAVVSENVLSCNVPCVVVENSRKFLSLICKKFYNSACDDLKIIMVTGTNGKTSITYLINAILNYNNLKCAIIGTNGIFFDNKQLYYGLTTPDPTELHYYFEVLKNMGAKYVVMEASAHAIKLEKLSGIKTEQIIFTNLTNEHLDYFKTMEDYANTKLNFLTNNNNKLAIVNADDDYGFGAIKNNFPVIAYGLKNPADTFGVNIVESLMGLNFTANVMDNVFKINSSLTGLYNVYNILASITSAKCLGLSDEQISFGVSSLVNIPGRFNKFFLDLNKLVVVDFAHTPDGFFNVLSEVKKFRNGNIVTLFGCVGYSDKNKRCEMGKIASMFSNKLIVTTDNINFENFDDVCDDILHKVSVPYVKIFDRALAIKTAFENLKENDTLMILGKGCETSNLINGVKVPHSDIEEVEKNIESFYGVTKGDRFENSIV